MGGGEGGEIPKQLRKKKERTLFNHVYPIKNDRKHIRVDSLRKAIT